MTRHTVAYKASTKQALVQMYGDALPGGYADVGNYYHNGGGTDTIAPTKDSHRMFHHVQELLYKQGEQNMQAVKIVFNYLTGITATAADVAMNLTTDTTEQINVTFAPTNASNRTVTYASSDPTKATVSDTGLITAVGAGTAVITVTSEEGGWTSQVTVTVS